MLMKNNEFLYQAYKLKDSSFDGVFFVGVTSTGIYCRPICRAKLPKEKFCQFFSTAKVAQDNGFRPCRRCRPDLTPGSSNVDMTKELAETAKKMIENGAVHDFTVEQLAMRLGITSRHLRRIFVTHYGITPVKHAQYHRLSLSEMLLKDKNLTITQIVLKTGFSSSRQFNALFKKKYQISPTEFRRFLVKK